MQSPREFLESRRKLVSELESALPALLAVENTLVRKPRISFYEGKEDMRRVYLDVLNAKGEILNYFQPEECYAFFGKEWLFQTYLTERVRRRIPIRVIMPDTPAARSLSDTAAAHSRQVRLIPKGEPLFENEIYVYDDVVTIFAFGDQIALQIRSADMASTQRAIFELAWNGASKPPKA